MRRRCAALLAALLSVIVAAPASAGPRSLHLGFVDNAVSLHADESIRALWLGRMAGVGADRIRLDVTWASIATRPPRAGEDPADPNWPGYSWKGLDTAVVEALANGLQPMLTLGNAPAWSEGAGRPASAPAGTWRPDPAAFGAFVRATARRYRTVRLWQVWNEPNLDTYLSPQWAGRRPAAPAHYRRLLNAAYAAVKAVDRRNLVISAGTAPFGDPGTGHRMPPAHFIRELLCLRGKSLRAVSCRDPAKFDILAHHPYSVRGPQRRALNPDDVSVPDLAKLVHPLRRAERTGRALPRKRHRVWVTEMSWDSSPPDPDGVPAARHARWLEESLYVLWRSGVDTVIWLLARDAVPVPSFAATSQSGVFFHDGAPKLAARAFAFPFVTGAVRRGRVQLWGKAPRAGRVTVQRLTGTRWATVIRLQARGAGHIFTKTIRLERGTKLRARVGSDASLVWSVR